MSLAFLGVVSTEEPLLKNELERQIYGELRTFSKYSLKPKEEISLLFKKGILTTPQISSKSAIKLSKTLSSRILAYGILQKMDMEYSRTWWRPWRGDLKFKHGMWIKIIDGENGKIRYSGAINVCHTVNNVYLGWEPRLGKLEPVFRHQQLNTILASLAKNATSVIQASTKGLKEKERKQKKLYDPSIFEKRRVIQKKRGTKFKKSKRVIPKKKQGYDPSLFKKKGPKKQEIPSELMERELEDEEIEELIQEEGGISDDVNLLEEGLTK